MAMIPVQAVGGAAGAVGGIADSGFVVGITRGRLWIGLLGALLGGIVALNVWGLSLSASTTGTAGKIDELVRKNSVLAATIAKRQSSDRIERAAAGLGLTTPTPKAIRYLRAGGDDAAKATKRLAAGELSVLGGMVAPEFAEAASAAADPSMAAPVAPIEDPAVSAPVEPAPVEPEPIAPADPSAAEPTVAAPPADGGGVTP